MLVGFVIDGNFALALSAGIIAALNPCGFAMLPAYLTYFIGTEDDEGNGGGLPRALAVSAALTAGFIAVFGLLGIGSTPFLSSIQSRLPWVTVVIGILLTVLGVAMLAGKQVILPVPKLQKGGGRELPSMFLFGVSYAVGSLSCTIGPFLIVMGSASSGGFVSGVSLFVTYGFGMGLFVSGLTVLVALARGAVVARIRRILPYVSRASGGLMILAGAYVAWYGYWEVRILRGELVDDPLASFGEDLRSRTNNWVVDFGEVRLAVVIGVSIAVLTGLTYGRRWFRATRQAASEAAADVSPPTPVEAS